MNAATVLFVDDEIGVLRAVKRLFRKSDVTLLTAGGGEEALALLDEQDVQAVFSDQRMPGMRGTDLLKEVRKRSPDTVRCILSGYAEMESVIAAINDGNVYRFIAKPWDDEELISIVHKCLEVAAETAAAKSAAHDLARKAHVLEVERARQAELLKLQELLLNSSRDILEQLPVAVVALDTCGRMIYTNRRFADEFGHLPGVALGEFADDSWRHLVGDAEPDSTAVVFDGVPYPAQVARVEIGGQPHTLVAMLASHT